MTESNPKRLIFISYATDPDFASAFQVASEIEAQGLSCWLAKRDVGPGENWAEAIITAIQSSEITLVLLSTAANKSSHVEGEIERARNYGKLILPLRIENIQPSAALEYHLAGRQWIDLFDARTRGENMSRLIAALRDRLRQWLVPDLPPLPRVLDTAVESTIATEQKPEPESPRHPVISASTVARPSADLQQAIETALEAAEWHSAAVSPYGRELYSRFQEQAVTALCSVAIDDRSWENRTKALRFVASIAAIPTARRFVPTILALYVKRLAAAGWELDAVLDGIDALTVPPREKWKVLIEPVSTGAVEQYMGHKIVAQLGKMTPRDKVKETGRAVAGLLFSTQSLTRSTALDVIRKLEYRDAIPSLRDMLETTTTSANIAEASKLLSEWGDRTCAISIRTALETGILTGSDFAITIKALYTLEGPEAAHFISDCYRHANDEQRTSLLTSAGLLAREPSFLRIVSDTLTETGSETVRAAASKFLASAR
jgi:TIR domain